MTVISKEMFYKNVDKNIHCRVLHYWEPNCMKAAISPYLLTCVAKGAAKFFLPIYLMKLLLNYKKIKDVDFVKSLLVAEATGVLYGVSLASLLILSICLLRKICGRLIYSFLFIPSTISGLSLLVESKENQIMNSLIFFNLCIEAVLKYVNFSYFKITRLRETLMFMSVSAVLMHLLENRTKKLNMLYFWFYTPNKRSGKDEVKDTSKVCSHSNTCYKFWYQLCLKYFSLGYLVNVIRTLVPKMGILIKKPQEILKILFNRSNIKSGLFAGGFVTIYEILKCSLLKWGVIKNKFHGLLAGFLSGLTYAIYPNIQILVIGITTLFQMLYSTLSEKLNIQNHFWPRQLLYMLCQGYLLHLTVLAPELCPSYFKNMINMTTSDLFVQVYEQMITKFFFKEVALKHIFKYPTSG